MSDRADQSSGRNWGGRRGGEPCSRQAGDPPGRPWDPSRHSRSPRLHKRPAATLLRGARPPQQARAETGRSQKPPSARPSGLRLSLASAARKLGAGASARRAGGRPRDRQPRPRPELDEAPPPPPPPPHTPAPPTPWRPPHLSPPGRAQTGCDVTWERRFCMRARRPDRLPGRGGPGDCLVWLARRVSQCSVVAAGATHTR